MGSSRKEVVQNLNHMTYWVGRYPCPHMKTVNLAPFLLYVTAKTLTAPVLVLLFFPHDNLNDEQDEGKNANKDQQVAEEEELAVHVERRPQAHPKLPHLRHNVRGCKGRVRLPKWMNFRKLPTHPMYLGLKMSLFGFGL